MPSIKNAVHVLAAASLLGAAVAAHAQGPTQEQVRPARGPSIHAADAPSGAEHGPVFAQRGLAGDAAARVAGALDPAKQRTNAYALLCFGAPVLA